MRTGSPFGGYEGDTQQTGIWMHASDDCLVA